MGHPKTIEAREGSTVSIQDVPGFTEDVAGEGATDDAFAAETCFHFVVAHHGDGVVEVVEEHALCV